MSRVRTLGLTGGALAAALAVGGVVSAPAQASATAPAQAAAKGRCEWKGAYYFCWLVTKKKNGHYDFTASMHKRLNGGMTGVAAWEGWLDFDKKNHYDSKIWAKDLLKDGNGTRHQFRYRYSNNTNHDTRVWGNDSGAGSSVPHVAYVHGGKAIKYIAFKGGLQKTSRYDVFYLDNPYR